METVRNLFQDIPDDLPEEIFQTILESEHFRLERIVSQGQSSPEGFWYDQKENEWVMVVSGRARLEFASGKMAEIKPGKHILIPAHEKHRVAWTDPKEKTVWLALFF